ncbi:MAG: YggS family pyridoxal phosphate-dependent enzyme [Ruminococcaceae bacterium]|nr:YggS family pyridoxal phosphate-dependent enzyme [Oscillospiraceae bacterium]
MMLTEQRKQEIRDNYSRVLENIENAKAKRGGDAPVRLLAATKTVPAEEIIFAADELGLKFAGENRTSELLEKYDALKDKLTLHLIGSLQTRKAKEAVGKVSLIESVDSIKLASEINKRSEAMGIVSDILLEVNIGREESKGGLMPEVVSEFMDSLEEFRSIRPCGIMTMAPICASDDEYRKFFSETYQIFIDIYIKKSHNIIEPVLSMGMSDSYVPAILEGATQVRVGSSIFGRRL